MARQIVLALALLASGLGIAVGSQTAELSDPANPVPTKSPVTSLNLDRSPLAESSSDPGEMSLFKIAYNEGELIFPESGIIVSVDPTFEDFKVVVLPGDDPETEYIYYAKIYTALPQTIPSDPTTVTATEVNNWSGDYLTEYLSELDHKEFKSDLDNAKKYLVVWEGTRPFDMEMGIGSGTWSYTYVSISYYPHTSNLEPAP